MGTRKNVCKKVYLNKDGEELGRSASADAHELQFRFYADGDESGNPTGDVLSVKRDDFNSEVIYCAGWHGLAQKLGDKFADSNRPDLTPYDLVMEQYDALCEGIWVAEGESAGPRTTMLLDAVIEALVAAGGIPGADSVEEVTDEQRATLAAKLKGADAKTTKDIRAEVAKDPRVAAVLRRMEAERAAARAKAAADALAAAQEKGEASGAVGGLSGLAL